MRTLFVVVFLAAFLVLALECAKADGSIRARITRNGGER